MLTLGINATFHDCSAALVCDGKVLAAVEEERFTRVKHGKRPVPFSVWQLPYYAIDYCLEQADCDLTQGLYRTKSAIHCVVGFGVDLRVKRPSV